MNAPGGEFAITSLAPGEVPSLLQLVRELARFERLEHEVEATEELLTESFFGPRPAAGEMPAAGELTHVFPDATTIAGLDPAVLPMPLARGRALVTLASALAPP